jgi:hypothetical protein
VGHDWDMAGEVTIPILPCGSIDEIGDFYRMLGFAVTYRQTRPNPYTVVRRDDIELHFCGLPDFDPQQSYGSCLVAVPDITALYESFAAAMRSVHGKILVSGIPRMTRPRRRANTGNLSGFSVVDPGGNWVRIFQKPHGHHDATPRDQPNSKLARTLQNAVVLGESKGDQQQAARILDSALKHRDDSTAVTDLVEALVYRAELAVALNDNDYAESLLTQVAGMILDDTDRERLDDALANADELHRVLRADHDNPDPPRHPAPPA